MIAFPPVAEAASGNLTMKVYNVDGTPAYGLGGNTHVDLVDSNGVYYPTQTIDSSSTVTWTGIPAGSYTIYVFHDPQNEMGLVEYWGSGQLVVNSGVTTSASFRRYTPYITAGTLSSTTIELGQSVTYAVTVTNPGAASVSCDAQLVVDRDQAPPWDYNSISSIVSIASGGSYTYSWVVTPSATGTYSRYVWPACSFTGIPGGSGFYPTDQATWSVCPGSLCLAVQAHVVATASASPTSGTAPLAVQFSGSAIGGISPYSYSWNFGDSTSTTGQSPSHTYYAAGTYTAVLTVTDGAGFQASSSVTITVTSVTSYSVTFSTSGLGSDATGSILIVDGTTYSVSQLPDSFSWSSGTSHSYSWYSTVAGSNGIDAYDWYATNGCGQYGQSGTFVVSSSCTVSATYSTIFYVTMTVSPSNDGTFSWSGGGVSSGSTTTSFTVNVYSSGAVVSIVATPVSGYSFSSWSSSSSISVLSPTWASTTATINGGGTITAYFQTTPPSLQVSTPVATPTSISQGQTSMLWAQPSGGTQPYTCQWFEETPGVTSYYPISGATTCDSYSFSPSASSAIGNYGFELQATDSESPPVTKTSSSASVQVAPAPSQTSIGVYGLSFQSDSSLVTGWKNLNNPFSSFDEAKDYVYAVNQIDTLYGSERNFGSIPFSFDLDNLGSSDAIQVQARLVFYYHLTESVCLDLLACTSKASYYVVDAQTFDFGNLSPGLHHLSGTYKLNYSSVMAVVAYAVLAEDQVTIVAIPTMGGDATSESISVQGENTNVAPTTCSYAVGGLNTGDIGVEAIEQAASSVAQPIAGQVNGLAISYGMSQGLNVGFLEGAGHILEDKEYQYVLPIVENTANLIITVVHHGSTVNLVATDPSGVQHELTSVNGTAQLVLDNPAVGEWKVDVVGTDIPSGGENFTLRSVIGGVSAASHCSPSSVVVGRFASCRVHVIGNSPTGIVTWTSNGLGRFSSTVCRLSRGFCSVRYTPTSSSSLSEITASYEGDSKNAPFNETFIEAVSARISKATAACTPESAVAGSTTVIICTAKVTGYLPTGTVGWSQTTSGTGSVSFTTAACTLASLTNPDRAMCSVTMTGSTSGHVIINATYVGDSNNQGSSSTAALTIRKASAAIQISCAESFFNVGMNTTCTATVTGVYPSHTGIVAWSKVSGTGVVTFSSMTCTLSSGSCSVTITATRAGSIKVKATYDGDSNNLKSSGTLVLTIT
ncbi:MAG: PKD domain-containing protein [Nitrososphaerales archaeon]